MTPMMEQYFEIKNSYKDHLLFYRLGDFYEMFFDDAIVASRALDLTLTGRDCGEAQRAPMCGVPFHSVDTYIGRLIEQGFKIAICEQMENPAEAKGIVKRRRDGKEVYYSLDDEHVSGIIATSLEHIHHKSEEHQ